MAEPTQSTPDQPTPGDIRAAAREADHLAHCPPCRDRRAASDALVAENGASMARRDRQQLGLHLTRRPAVNA